MDIAGVSSSTMASISNSSTRTGDAVAISVQKKAMDIQAQAAGQLIESAAAVSESISESAGRLGANLDVKA